MTRSLAHFALAAVVLLAGCADDAAPAQEGASASGEILPASTSDAMIPLDSVRSQPPLLDPEPAASAAPGEADAADDEPAEGGEAAAEPAPAESADEAE